MKSNVVPLLGIIEAPGVKVNLGANAVISVPAFTINVTLLFSIIGSRLSTSPGTEHAMMSASGFFVNLAAKLSFFFEKIHLNAYNTTFYNGHNVQNGMFLV